MKTITIGSLKIENKSDSHIWCLSLPSMPWKVENAYQEREAIFLDIASRFSICAVWLSDLFDRNKEGWHLLKKGVSPYSLDEDMYHGSWAAYFYNNNDINLENLDLVPTLPAGNFLCDFKSISNGAEVCIWACEDDKDWVIFDASGVLKFQK